MNQLLSKPLPVSQSHQQQRANGSASYEAQIKAIDSANAGEILQVPAYNLDLNERYCKTIVKQANRSFWSAIVAASVGLVFFVITSTLLILNKQDSVQMPLITGLNASSKKLRNGIDLTLCCSVAGCGYIPCQRFRKFNMEACLRCNNSFRIRYRFLDDRGYHCMLVYGKQTLNRQRREVYEKPFAIKASTGNSYATFQLEGYRTDYRAGT